MSSNSEYKVIYTVFEGDIGSGKGASFSTTNKRALSELTDIGYDNLVRIFTRQKRFYYCTEKFIIIKSDILFKQCKRKI